MFTGTCCATMLLTVSMRVSHQWHHVSLVPVIHRIDIQPPCSVLTVLLCCVILVCCPVSVMLLIFDPVEHYKPSRVCVIWRLPFSVSLCNVQVGRACWQFYWFCLTMKGAYCLFCTEDTNDWHSERISIKYSGSIMYQPLSFNSLMLTWRTFSW